MKERKGKYSTFSILLKRKKVKIPLHGVDSEILGRNIRGFHFLLDKKRRLERTL
jgi:hypothetical protein